MCFLRYLIEVGCRLYWLSGTAPDWRSSASIHWDWPLLRARRERPRCSCAAEQRDEQPPLHSITSSARNSSEVGTSRLSALAVLRLMISSIFVTCCTGGYGHGFRDEQQALLHGFGRKGCRCRGCHPNDSTSRCRQETTAMRNCGPATAAGLEVVVTE